MREQILDSIIEVKEKKTNIIVPILNKELKFESSKYSSTKENIWHLFINDIKIKKTSEYLISYKCLSCNQTNIVGTTQFLRKIRQCKTQCYQCYQCKTQCYQCNINSNDTKEKLSLFDIYQKSIKDFELFPDQYTNTYFLSHLSEDDYSRIKKNIISLGNGKYLNMDEYEFWSIYKVDNQMKFSSVLYDKINNIIFKAFQPIMKCDNCEKHWRCKSLESFKNCYKILCPECKSCNRIFNIRSIKNNNNEIILYQSKLELKFINWCNSNNIIVKNGPNIDKKYHFNFQINDILIAIKDFHNGLWEAKKDAINNYIKEGTRNITKIFLITPNSWNQMLTEIKNIIK
jgi:hypothetical protein